VRYSIEQGLVGPGVRVTLGALLAAALVGGGEWMRRQRRIVPASRVCRLRIPSILTAAGTTVSYATVLPPTRFTVSLVRPRHSCCWASWLSQRSRPHCCWTGVGGAWSCRRRSDAALVATGTPNYWALYIYLAVDRVCIRVGARAAVALACHHGRGISACFGHCPASAT
jgi:hypothetical protein